MSSFERKLASIVEALDTFESLLPAERPQDLSAFVAGRVALSREVAAFLSEEWNNLPRNLGQSDHSSQADLEALHRAFVSLRADYSRHIGRWNNSALVRDWLDYRQDCRHLIKSMRHLVQLRSRSLFRHVA